MPNLNAQIRKVYSDQFLLEYGKRYTILDWCDLQLANPLIRTAGDTIEFLRFGDESVTESKITSWSTESQFSPTLTYNTPADSIQQLKIDRLAFWTRKFSDVKLDIYAPGVVEQISRLAARAVRDYVEENVLSEMFLKSTGESSIVINTPSTAAAVLTAGAGTPFLARHVGCLAVNKTKNDVKSIITLNSSSEVVLDSAPTVAWVGGDDVAVVEADEMDFSSPANIKNFFRDLKSYFDESNFPFEGRFVCLSPRAFSYLSAIDEFTNELYVGTDRVIRTGDVGSLFGFSIFMSNCHLKAGQVQRGVAGVMSDVAPPFAVYVKKDFDIEMLRAENQFADLMRGRLLWGMGSVGKEQTDTRDGNALAAPLTGGTYKSHLGLVSIVATGL